MNATRFKPWLLLAITFVAGLVVGATITRVAVGRAIHRATNDPQYVRTEIERKLTRELRLRPDQQAVLHNITGRTMAEMKALRGELNPRMTQIIERSEQELRAALDEKQKAKFDKLRKERSLRYSVAK